MEHDIVNKPIPNLPVSNRPKLVILGGGFAGLKLARKMIKSEYQVILLDKNNYHQFQPLFYQVATASLEPSAISFPLRRVFHHFPLSSYSPLQRTSNCHLFFSNSMFVVFSLHTTVCVWCRSYPAG